MDVGNSKPLYLLGVIQHNQGRHKEAAEALERVVKIKDEASVRYSLGVLYIYFLEDTKRGAEHLRAGLNDPTASEELKAAIQQELEWGNRCRNKPRPRPPKRMPRPMPRPMPMDKRQIKRLTKRQIKRLTKGSRQKKAAK